MTREKNLQTLDILLYIGYFYFQRSNWFRCERVFILGKWISITTCKYFQFMHTKQCESYLCEPELFFKCFLDQERRNDWSKFFFWVGGFSFNSHVSGAGSYAHVLTSRSTSHHPKVFYKHICSNSELLKIWTSRPILVCRLTVVRKLNQR